MNEIQESVQKIVQDMVKEIPVTLIECPELWSDCELKDQYGIPEGRIPLHLSDCGLKVETSSSNKKDQHVLKVEMNISKINFRL